MNTQQKLDVLSKDAQYDLSCACGTKNPLEHRKRDVDGNGWLYPVTTASGGAGIMLKTLLGNRCSNDCKYCPLRMQQDFRPVALSPSELASFFFNFQLHRSLLGLFLSSAVMDTPEKTMQMLVDTATILRKKYRYRGYIHLKVIPGASRESIDSALRYASAVSLNIETPGAGHFGILTDRKDYLHDIIEPLKYIASRTGKGTDHPRTHLTSQFIVGASDEKDQEILHYTDAMYRRLHCERLYFSSYQRGLGDPSIPGEQVKPVLYREDGQLYDEDVSGKDALTREHRLYQADWLLRKYHFSYDDLTFGKDGNLSLAKDPKRIWAERHPDFYPVSALKASMDDLMRVPGVGPETARKIVKARKDSVFADVASLPLSAAAKKNSKGYLVL